MPQLTDEIRTATLTEQEAYARDILIHLTDEQLAALKRQWGIDSPASTLLLVGRTGIDQCIAACTTRGLRLTRSGVGAFKVQHGITNTPPYEGVIGGQTAAAVFAELTASTGTRPPVHVVGALHERIVANRPVYEDAEHRVGVPWRLLASVHFREHECLRTSPGPGGAFQLDPPWSDARVRAVLQRYDLSFQRVEADFLRAAVVSAYVLQSKVNFAIHEATTDPTLLKDALWGYNGRFFGAADNSPYVANDPPHRVLRIRGSVIRADGRRVRVDRPDPRPGAWIIYQELLTAFS